MQFFDSTKVKELRSFLRQSNIHDGVFRKFLYDYLDQYVLVDIQNPIWKTFISIMFLDVKYFVCISDNKWGTNETIIGLFVEKDPSEFSKYLDQFVPIVDDCVACLFEMLSGNKILVYCSTIQVSIGDVVREP